MIPPISKENRDNSIDHQQVEREWRKVFLILFTDGSKGIMGLPIRCYLGVEKIHDVYDRRTFKDLVKASSAGAIEMGQLRDTDMRKILGAQA